MAAYDVQKVLTVHHWNESLFTFTCTRGASLRFESGHFVMVGNAGDVIDTRTRQVIAHLPPLRETRKMLEIDWADGVPVSASPREGLGYRRP